MICDVDTRIWSARDDLGPVLAGVLRRLTSDRLVPPDASPDAHAAAMRPVARAFLLGARSRRLECRLPNDQVAAAVRARPDRLVGFAGIDPLTPEWRDEFDRAGDLGLSGITVSPSLQGCPPTHAQAMRLWERCVDKGLPVIVSRPTPMPEQAVMECDRPTHWDEVLRTFPRLRVVFASFGTPYIEETLLLLAKFEHVYTHCGGSLRRPVDTHRWLTAALDAGVIEKVLFASGFPFETPMAALERLYGLCVQHQGGWPAPLSRRVVQSVAERDALTALGIRDRGELLRHGEQQALLSAAESLRTSD